MFTSGASTSNELIKIMLAEICYKTSQLETLESMDTFNQLIEPVLLSKIICNC